MKPEPPDTDRLIRAIREIRTRADVAHEVPAGVPWRTDYVECPGESCERCFGILGIAAGALR